MEQIKETIRSMIEISDEEMDKFLSKTSVRKIKKNQILSKPDIIPTDIYFINSGMLRVTVTDETAVEHTIHFALENQFISDYSSFLMQQKSIYTFQALEDTEVVVLPRAAILWGYDNLTNGNKLGRLIAEFYFIYQDARVKNMYTVSPKKRYDIITDIFPNIHNRVPQHMIASYLGITSVHLSRLKKTGTKKT